MQVLKDPEGRSSRERDGNRCDWRKTVLTWRLDHVSREHKRESPGIEVLQEEDLEFDEHWSEEKPELPKYGDNEEPEEPTHDQAEPTGQTARLRSPKDRSKHDSAPRNNDPNDLALSEDQIVMNELYSTSKPNAGIFVPGGHRSTPISSLASLKKAQFSLSSARSFNTAHSSLASYVTASSGPLSTKFTPYNRNLSINMRSVAHGSQPIPTVAPKSRTTFDDIPDFPLVVNAVFSRAILFLNESKLPLPLADQALLRSWVHHALVLAQTSRSEFIAKHDNSTPIGVIMSLLNDETLQQYTSSTEVAECILSFQLADGEEGFHFHNNVERRKLKSDLTFLIVPFLSNSSVTKKWTPTAVFSSDWLIHLRSRGILLDPKDELDWSGRGQHVEYKLEDADLIPLIQERTLGHSASAIVESVKCRRIRLARKRITCNRRLKKEDAITEVEHLQRLQHSHIVRVIGTYTLGKHLSILLYPATLCNLDEFMDEELGFYNKLTALNTFFGCLSNAIRFIHSKNVKHMDIKPKNLLVRPLAEGRYKIYVADFGIARAYKSASDCETDSPVSFTRAYAAPEVVLQDKRGFSADIFSLGCVFIEMRAALFDQRQKLLDLRFENSGHSGFYASIDVILSWCEEVLGEEDLDTTIPLMINREPESRPTSEDLQVVTSCLCCSTCHDGPEPFEAAKKEWGVGSSES
ncbi:Nn.00g022340.m01.CDS01 [Neocucurbitaria sp. VM-36]